MYSQQYYATAQITLSHYKKEPRTCLSRCFKGKVKPTQRCQG